MSNKLSFPLLSLCPASSLHLTLLISTVSALLCFSFPGFFFLLFFVSWYYYFSYAALLSDDKAVFINISRPSHQQTNSNMSDVILEIIFLFYGQMSSWRLFFFLFRGPIIQTPIKFGAMLVVWELWRVGFQIKLSMWVCYRQLLKPWFTEKEWVMYITMFLQNLLLQS